MSTRLAAAALAAAATVACSKSDTAPPTGPRTVTGTFQLVHWTDDGARTAVPTPPDPSASPRPSAPPVAALVPTAAGYDVKPGTVDAAGRLSIPGVPQGRFFLAVEGSVLRLSEHTADALDLSSHVLGRADAVLPVATTPVTISVSGLSPWTSSFDLVTVTSSNAGLWTAPWGLFYVGEDLADGTTSASLSVDFQSTVFGALPLPDSSRGDVVHLAQLSVRPGTTVGTRVLTRSARLTGVSLAAGAAGVITADLQAVPQTGRVSIDFRQSAFEALAPQMGPGASANTAAVWVDASAHPLTHPGPQDAAPDLVLVERLPGDPDFVEQDIAYGQPFDSLWHEWRGENVIFTVPFQVGTASPRTAVAVVAQSAAMSPALSPVVVPRISPPRRPTVGGRDAFQPQSGVGTTPVLAWSAPDIGSPSRYEVEVYRLTEDQGISRRTLVLRAELKGGTSSLRIPPDVLLAGQPYHASIRAARFDADRVSEPGAAWRRVPGDWANCVTATFTP